MGFDMAFGEQSILGKLGLVVALAPLGVALLCAVKPTERRLALMRPLTLATIFAALCSFTIGVANMLHGLAATGDMTQVAWQAVAAGGAETIVPLIVAFGCLTVSWLLVALGLRRT